MFERFTSEARQAVVKAQDEARRLDHGYIDTEHILLGLIRVKEGMAARALADAGISLAALRERVEQVVGRGPEEPGSHIPFTPGAKRSLELSLRESKALKHHHIGTEHILLGVIQVSDGVAARVLTDLGTTPEAVRRQVVDLLDESG